VVVAPVAEASVDLCAVASGLVCLPCLPPFAINKAQAAGGVCGGQQVATDGRGPVQSSGATRKDSARLCARSLAGLLPVATCQSKESAKRRKGDECGSVVLFRLFFFCQPQPYLFDPFVSPNLLA
jgi:hypothetical protein